MPTEDQFDQIASVAALADPVRRSLYTYVAEQEEPVGRDEAATALDVPRHVAKFNLDRLEQEGLLAAGYARPAGRSGPGAGRPAKVYRRSAAEVSVSLPERHYELAGHVLAAGITMAQERHLPVRQAVSEAARAAGQELGAAARAAVTDEGPTGPARTEVIVDVLRRSGYEPRLEGTLIRLGNCPFHRLSREHTDLVCGMNLDLLTGVVEAAGATGVTARLDPVEGQCCVVMDLAT
ncbi:MAG: transcriptional regulator [Nostocoides sp.]